MESCIYIHEERCAGCGSCVEECPKGLLFLDMQRVNARQVHPAAIAKPQNCIGCGRCADVCAHGVLDVHRRRKAR